MNKGMSLQAKIEVAIFAALAMIIDILPSITIAPAVSISFSMVPIFIICFRWGFKSGVVAGFLWGLLQVVTGTAYVLTPLQAFIEYFIAFAFIGLAGLLSGVIKQNLAANNRTKAFMFIILAIIIGSVARYFWHFVAGLVFWGSYAPKGVSALWYSFTMNGLAMVGSMIACLIILAVLIPSAARVVLNRAS